MSIIGLVYVMDLYSHKRGATVYAIGKHFGLHESRMVAIIALPYNVWLTQDVHKSYSRAYAGTMILLIDTISTEKL